MRLPIAALACLPLLAGCSTGLVADADQGPQPDLRDAVIPRADGSANPSVLGDMFGGGRAGNVVIAGRTDPLGAAPVNRHLWRASLDTLSFLPLASTDPFTGVIATDWGATPDAPDERFKVTAYVTAAQLDATALRVAVFRETRENGAWVTAPVAAETPRRIEDAILVRARQLRLAEREQG